MLPDLKKIIEQALSQKIKVTQGGRQRTLTMFEVGIEKLVQQFAKGDRHARKDFFELAEQVDLDLRCSEPIPRIDREPAWHEIARQFTDDQILMLIKAERIKERVIARTQPCQDRPVSVQSTKPVQNPALRH